MPSALEKLSLKEGSEKVAAILAPKCGKLLLAVLSTVAPPRAPGDVLSSNLGFSDQNFVSKTKI